jgi:hypothetical protein
MGLFPESKEITESVGCLLSIKMHFAKILKLSDDEVTCIVVGDGAKPRTAALACFMTKWRRVISIDPAITPETMKEFAEVHRIDRLEMRPDRMQDTVIEIDPKKDKCVLIILPHAHLCPNTAIAQLHFPESCSKGSRQHAKRQRQKGEGGVNGGEKEAEEAAEGEEEEEEEGGAAEKQELPRVAIYQLPCCDYQFHDRCAGKSADSQYHDYSIASLNHLVRCWWDVAPSARDTGALSIGSRLAKVRENYPHSSSMDRRGWKKKVREARKARKKPRRANGVTLAKAQQPMKEEGGGGGGVGGGGAGKMQLRAVGAAARILEEEPALVVVGGFRYGSTRACQDRAPPRMKAPTSKTPLGALCRGRADALACSTLGQRRAGPYQIPSRG